MPSASCFAYHSDTFGSYQRLRNRQPAYSGIGATNAGQGFGRRPGGTARRVAGRDQEARAGAEATAAHGAHQPTTKAPPAHGDGDAGGGARTAQPIETRRAATAALLNSAATAQSAVGVAFYFFLQIIAVSPAPTFNGYANSSRAWLLITPSPAPHRWFLISSMSGGRRSGNCL